MSHFHAVKGKSTTVEEALHFFTDYHEKNLNQKVSAIVLVGTSESFE